MNSKYLIGFVVLAVILFLSCGKQQPNYYKLGQNSFDGKNYSLARNQFRMIEPTDENYDSAQKYIDSIESIERAIYKLSIKEDSLAKDAQDKLRSRYSGTYKIEVLGTSSKKEVEVYKLNVNGQAEWLWVYYKGGFAEIDDRKTGTWFATEDNITINIQGNSGMITEVYSNKQGMLINVPLSKRRLEKTNESF